MSAFKVVKASGHNNACLFVSLRTGLEVFTLLNRWRKTGAVPAAACVDGFHVVMYKSAEELRQLIMTWYKDGLEKELPGFGVYREAVKSAAAPPMEVDGLAVDAAAGGDDTSSPDGGAAEAQGTSAAAPKSVSLVPATPGRNWFRGDLLALEMVRRGRDVPDEDGEARTDCMGHYIEEMKEIGTMGGTPEYVGFAFMAKLNIEVFQKLGRRAAAGGGAAAAGGGPEVPPGYFIVNSVQVPEARGTIRLLYNGINHYDLLLSPQDAVDIKTIWSDSRLVGL